MDISEALAGGPRTSKEIQAVTGRSQASVSRLIRQNESILQLPGKRPHSYVQTRAAFGTNDMVPIATVDTNGKNVPRAMLRPLRPHGNFVTLLDGASHLLAGESGVGIFDDLPYYLTDARPQGFLGRIIAQNLSMQSEGFSPEPDAWSAEQVGRYLISNGDDLPGDLVFGFSMMDRLRNKPNISNRKDYSNIADSTLAGLTGVSSAGGEQQKFATFISDIESHVIVKFTPAYDDLTSRRWRDILVTEFHALSMLSECGFTAADTKLLEQNGRYFLESKRFDRRGWLGRSSMFSLRTIDAEFLGNGGTWTDVFTGLYKAGLVSFFDMVRAQELELFGKLINNTDMHLGNLSLSIDGDIFSLLPVYDMCSMGIAPKGTEVTDIELKAFEASEFEHIDNSAAIFKLASAFWGRVANDDRTSDELRSQILSSEIQQALNTEALES